MKINQQRGAHLWLQIGLVALVATVLIGSAPLTPAFLSGRSEQAQQPQRVDPIRAVREQQQNERGRLLIENGIVTSEQEVDSAVGTAQAVADNLRFVRVTDATEELSVDVPAEWQDVDLGQWHNEDHVVGVFVSASTDLDAFEQDLSAPGMFFGASAHFAQESSEAEMLALEEQRLLAKFPSCQRIAEVEYVDQLVVGHYYAYRSCSASTHPRHTYLILVATPPTGEYLVVLRINQPGHPSFKTITGIFDTFQVVGNLGLDEHHQDEEHDAHTH